jgi:hypothetical protein
MFEQLGFADVRARYEVVLEAHVLGLIEDRDTPPRTTPKMR